MSKPAISVVIPLFNAQEWIAETLQSLFGQTIDPSLLEVLIVDDGSTDQGLNVAKSVLSNCRSAWRTISIPNGGQSRARNVGARETVGSWIQFLDADDLLHPEKIERQWRVAQFVGEDVASVYSPWRGFGLLDGTWRDEGPMFSATIENDPVRELLETENTLLLGCQLLRRDWFDRVGGFDETRPPIEDVHLALKLAAAGAAFTLVPTPFAALRYRHRPKSSSRVNDARFVDGCLRNAEFAESYFLGNGGIDARRADTLARCYAMGVRFHATNDLEQFDALAKKVMTLAPGFAPAEPMRTRVLAKCLGYRNAEQLAGRYRRLKRALRDRFAP